MFALEITLILNVYEMEQVRSTDMQSTKTARNEMSWCLSGLFKPEALKKYWNPMPRTSMNSTSIKSTSSQHGVRLWAQRRYGSPRHILDPCSTSATSKASIGISVDPILTRDVFQVHPAVFHSGKKSWPATFSALAETTARVLRSV
jgi:hypothetical protein